MTVYEQGGAETAAGPPHTKKALKEAIKDAPDTVFLYSTSAVSKGWKGLASDLPEGTQFNVVGPDPYHRRDWYATVKRNSKGNIVAS